MNDHAPPTGEQARAKTQPRRSALSRRTLTMGAVWSVPAAIITTAAPALAASNESAGPQVLLWTDFPRSGSGTVELGGSTTVAGVTATASISGNWEHPLSKAFTPVEPGNLILCSPISGDIYGRKQILSLTFSAPVRNVSVVVSNLGRTPDSVESPAFSDQIYIPDDAPRFSGAQALGKIQGQGTSADPFMAAEPGAPGPLQGVPVGGPQPAPANTEEASAAEAAVRLHWNGPVQDIRIAYAQGRFKGTAMSEVLVSAVTFSV